MENFLSANQWIIFTTPISFSILQSPELLKKHLNIHINKDWYKLHG